MSELKSKCCGADKKGLHPSPHPKFKFGDKVTVIRTINGHKCNPRKGVVVDLFTIQDCIGVHTEYPNEKIFYYCDRTNLKRGWKK